MVASVSLRRRAYGQFMAIHVQKNIWIRCWIRLDLCHPMTKMSYLGLSVNASCSRYLKIISCWPRTAKSTEGCNLLIISSGLRKSMKKRWFLRRKSYAFSVWKLSFLIVKAIEWQCKSYAFTKKKMKNDDFRPFKRSFFSWFTFFRWQK